MNDQKPILVVDDDAQIRRTVRWALEDEGLPVVTAADGRQALDRAAAQPPALVVLDMGLPRLDGDGVAGGLHALYDGRVPIVVITADGSAAEKARRVGAVSYLAKPFEIDDLIAAVRHALAG